MSPSQKKSYPLSSATRYSQPRPSTQRSSSGVRSLRAFFEDKDDTSRGRSPSSTASSGHKENLSPNYPATRKVRSSFVSISPSGRVTMESSVHASTGTSQHRRESFSMQGDQATASSIRKSISQEKDMLELNDGQVPEVAATAGPTPIAELSEPPMSSTDTATPSGAVKSLEHSDKPVTSAEDVGAELKPADPKDAAFASGATSSGKKASDAAKSKLNALATKVKPSRPSGVGSKTSPKSPVATSSSSNGTSGKLSEKAKSVTERLSNAVKPSRQSTDSSAATSSPPHKTSRSAPLSSHLTAPTAASLARQENKAKENTPAPAAKKPAAASSAVTSRLTAPTAASAARNGKAAESKPALSRPRASLAAGSKPPSGRASLPAHSKPAEPKVESKSAATSKPASGDFLSRMTKPTAASTGHGKEAPAPAKVTSAATKPANGVVKKPAGTARPKPKDQDTSSATKATSAGDVSTAAETPLVLTAEEGEPAAETATTAPEVPAAGQATKAPAAEVAAAPSKTEKIESAVSKPEPLAPAKVQAPAAAAKEQTKTPADIKQSADTTTDNPPILAAAKAEDPKAESRPNGKPAVEPDVKADVKSDAKAAAGAAAGAKEDSKAATPAREGPWKPSAALTDTPKGLGSDEIH